MAEFPVKKFQKLLNMFIHLSSFVSVYFFLISTCNCDSSVNDNVESFESFYMTGIRAYQDERWYECYNNIKNAISFHRSSKEKLLGCRKFCQDESLSKLHPKGSVDLRFFESALHRSNCLRRCSKAKGVSNFRSVSASVKFDFEHLTQYDYLQICAYKIERYEDAAAAAYTFLVANPNHDTMQSNVEYYRLMPEVNDEFFVDLERKKYQDHYERAIELYIGEQYRLVTVEMEAALVEFYKEGEKCRLLCEESYDHESLPYLYNAVADHWLDVLRCRQKCEVKLRTFDGEYIPKFLPEMYNYLQFSYYQSGDMESAVRACQSYLLFYPDNEPMLNNRRYYMDDMGVGPEQFMPRQDAVTYHTMLEAEQRMIDFVTNDYTFSDADLDSQGQIIPEALDEDLFRDPYGSSSSSSLLLKDNRFPHLPLGERTEEFLTSLRAYTAENGVVITEESEELLGPTRVLADGLLTQEQCNSLIELAEKGGTQGDGYKGTEHRSSPHTDFEQFVGVTVSSAAQLTVSGKVSGEMLQTYLKASQAARGFMEKYNNLQVPLHFHYTHLVCRTALQDQDGREDLSHPIHADNCVLQEDGTCLKQKPAYTMRDFSALLYLNGDFTGGDFFFAHVNQTVQRKVRPKCGRMVGFESGTYHGVEAVTGGKRCALALWFTLDSTQQEMSHKEAALLLSGLSSRQRPLQNPQLKKMVDENGYEIIMTESELNGPERFAADNVISPEMCQSLIDLAVAGAVDNDGYSHEGALQSPQSQNEAFSGLTLDKAAKKIGVFNEGYNHKSALQSPQSGHENYVGLTLNRAAKLAEDKLISPELVYNFLKSSRDSMDLVEKYFNLSTPLYFDYTHLVCRTARNDKNKDRKDLSHPIHSDNCLIKPDGRCIKERPAYIQRDYSALLYLNADFDGGEFIFTDTDFSIQSTLKPTCGRLVGFNASNYHGVKAVLRGRRCALAMWYTLDASYKEAAHGIAQKVLTKLNYKPQGTRDEL